jgi:hypothetical protein
MALLWDELDDFVDASQEPLVVAPAPAPTVVRGPASGWPALTVAAAAAAVLALLLWPASSPEPLERGEAMQPEEQVPPPPREPLPLDGELDADDVVPHSQHLLQPDDDGAADVALPPPPVEPPCPEAGAWWRLESPMPSDCVVGFLEQMGTTPYELHRVLIGAAEVPAGAERMAMRTFATQEIARLSREGRPGDATLLAARVVRHRGLATRSVLKAGALAGRDWSRATDDAGEAERRRAIAYELADGWVNTYLYENSEADLLAVTVRDSLAPADDPPAPSHP